MINILKCSNKCSFSFKCKRFTIQTNKIIQNNFKPEIDNGVQFLCDWFIFALPSNIKNIQK